MQVLLLLVQYLGVFSVHTSHASLINAFAFDFAAKAPLFSPIQNFAVQQPFIVFDS